jgi:hypothetical protein
MSINPPTKPIRKRDEPDSNTRLLFRGGIIGALITGICVCLAAVAQAALSQRPVHPTVTPSPSSTPVTPTPTLTPTPGSPAEAALVQWLSALRDGASDREAFARASSVVSTYSLKFFDLTSEDLESIYRSQAERGDYLVDFKVINGKALEDNSVHFRIVWTLESAGSQTKQDKFFTVHKDEDGIWRVNEKGLVDYRPVTSAVISDPSTGISMDPVVVQRFEDHLIVAYNGTSPTGHFYWVEPERPSCQFPSAIVSGEFQDGKTTKLIYLDGFFEDYPISCAFPDLDNKPATFPRWKAPTIVLSYE